MASDFIYLFVYYSRFSLVSVVQIQCNVFCKVAVLTNCTAARLLVCAVRPFGECAFHAEAIKLDQKYLF